MKPVEFVSLYWDEAKSLEQRLGFNALFTLAQAALESGWGDHAPGFNFFGIKVGRNWSGEKQLVTTTEFHATDKVFYPEILSIEKVGSRFKYKVKDFFRKYPTAVAAFEDHANFFMVNQRYKDAVAVREDPYKFAQELQKAGYATVTDKDGKLIYADLLGGVIKSVEKAVSKWGVNKIIQ